MGETLLSFQKIEYDHVHTEDWDIINASKISNGDDEIDDVWNFYNYQKVLDKNAVNFKNVWLLKMIENWWYQGSTLIIWKRTLLKKTEQ